MQTERSFLPQPSSLPPTPRLPQGSFPKDPPLAQLSELQTTQAIALPLAQDAIALQTERPDSATTGAYSLPKKETSPKPSSALAYVAKKEPASKADPAAVSAASKARALSQSFASVSSLAKPAASAPSPSPTLPEPPPPPPKPAASSLSQRTSALLPQTLERSAASLSVAPRPSSLQAANPAKAACLPSPKAVPSDFPPPPPKVAPSSSASLPSPAASSSALPTPSAFASSSLPALRFQDLVAGFRALRPPTRSAYAPSLDPASRPSARLAAFSRMQSLLQSQAPRLGEKKTRDILDRFHAFLGFLA